MALSTTDLITQLYVAYFNRPADVRGLAFWVDAVDNKKIGLDVISKEFNKSPEYTKLFAGKGSESIVNIVYQNLFGRTPDTEGLNFWTKKLDDKVVTVADLVKAVFAGALNADGTPNNDGLVFANKVAAAAAFTTEIGTPGNEAERIAYAEGTDATKAAAKAYITGVTDDASLTTTIAGVHAVAQSMLPVAPVLTYTLTTGIDTGAAFAGGAGNDIFDASKGAAGAATLGALDSIDGGAGNDTLNVTQIDPVSLTAATVVKNIEAANIVSGGTIAVNAAAWQGLTNMVASSVGGENITVGSTAAVNATDTKLGTGNIVIDGGTAVTVTALGSTTGTITVGGTTAPTGAVVISNTTAGAVKVSGTITVNGGTTVDVKQAATNTVNTTQGNGAVVVNGSALTSSVMVAASAAATPSATVAGVIANTVTINDVNKDSATKAGTITSVSVDGYTTLGFNGTGLTSLNVAHGSGDITITDSGLTTPTNKTLALGLNGVTGGTLRDSDIYTTFNVTTSGADSTLANLGDTALTALNVAGSKGLTLTATTLASKLAAVTVSGAAGLTADVSGATVTSVNTAASTGTTTVTINAANASYTGGAGVDNVTLTTGNVTKAINLGAGNDSLVLGALTTAVAINGGSGVDTLSISAGAAATASGDATFAGLVTGFEKLVLTGAGSQSIDLAALGNYNNVSTAAGNGLSLSNLNSGGTLALTGAGLAYTIGNSAFAAGTNDVINVALSDNTGTNVNFATSGITAANVETFAITVADNQAVPTGTVMDALTLLGNSVKTITVAGNAGLNLAAQSTALTNVDASGIAATGITPGFAWISGALTGAATVKGSATGINTIDTSAATGIVTYTGGTGVDTVILNGGKANVVHLGSGTTDNTVTIATGTAGNHSVDSTATGTDDVTLGSGNNIVSLGNGVNKFTATSGNNTYVGGTGADTVTVGGGVNTITTGTGADMVIFTAPAATLNAYSTITDAHAGLSIKSGIVALGNEVFNSAKLVLADTASFQDYANAVVAAGGNSSVNGHFGWFVFDKNTYLIESRHDASAPGATFSNGLDGIVKLAGVVDLSNASVVGHAILLA